MKKITFNQLKEKYPIYITKIKEIIIKYLKIIIKYLDLFIVFLFKNNWDKKYYLNNFDEENQDYSDSINIYNILFKKRLWETLQVKNIYWITFLIIIIFSIIDLITIYDIGMTILIIINITCLLLFWVNFKIIRIIKLILYSFFLLLILSVILSIYTIDSLISKIVGLIIIFIIFTFIIGILQEIGKPSNTRKSSNKNITKSIKKEKHTYISKEDIAQKKYSNKVKAAYLSVLKSGVKGTKTFYKRNGILVCGNCGNAGVAVCDRCGKQTNRIKRKGHCSCGGEISIIKCYNCGIKHYL